MRKPYTKYRNAITFYAKETNLKQMLNKKKSVTKKINYILIIYILKTFTKALIYLNNLVV